MSELRNAFDRRKHEAVKFLAHKSKEIYISTMDIFNAQAEYGPKEYRKFVNDKFVEKHGVTVTEFEKLVFYVTIDDNTMKIVGHIGYSLSEPKA